MKDNFFTCLEETLKWEGGYSNHPLDPGGPTNLGIIQDRYDQYNKDLGRPNKSVKQITKEEAIDIYRKYYWDKVNGDNLPYGLDLAVFDFGVNSGPSRANSALKKVGPDIKAYMNERERFLKSLKTFATFGKGWMNRTTGIRKKALSMLKDPPLKEAKKIVLQNSSKLSVFQNLRRFAAFIMAAVGGVFGLDTFNLATDMATTLKSFMTIYGIWIVLGTIGFSWLVLKWGEYKHLIDFKEGRYIPSGMTAAKTEGVE